MINNYKVLEKNFRLNNMNAHFVKDQNELYQILETLILDKQIVGTADSVTLEELGVFRYLKERNITYLDKHDPSLNKQEKRKIYLDNFSSDVFITGTNAITMDGYLFNIDGNGSRVAPMIYGPNKVIIIVGKNKICETTKGAIHRTRQIAAPLDAKRLHKNTPCTKLDQCIDCKHKERICNDFVLITHQFDSNRIHVIIVDEELGY